MDEEAILYIEGTWSAKSKHQSSAKKRTIENRKICRPKFLSIFREIPVNRFMLYDRRKVQHVLRFSALSMRFFAIFFVYISHYLTHFAVLKLKLDNRKFSRRAHHQFVLNACEVQRFRRLSCFGAKASTCGGCAVFPPSLAPSTDNLWNAVSAPEIGSSSPVLSVS